MFDPKNEDSARRYAGQWLTLAGPNLTAYAAGIPAGEHPAVRRAAVAELRGVVGYLQRMRGCGERMNINTPEGADYHARDVAGLESLIFHIKGL